MVSVAHSRSVDDALKATGTARFVTLMEALPPDQAAPLWQTAQAQASAALIR